MINANRLTVFLAFAISLLLLLWIAFSQLLVPALIESAYRGESFPVLNRIISGQSTNTIEHYLTVWNNVAWRVLLILLVLGLVLLLFTSGEFQKLLHAKIAIPTYIVSTVNCIALCLFVILIYVNSIGQLRYREVAADAMHYLAMAYNLQRYGTLSLSNNDKSPPEPTAYRAPGYPLFLALGIALDPRLRRLDLSSLLSAELQRRLWSLRYAQVFLLVLTSLFAMFIVWKITYSLLASYFTLALVGFSSATTITQADRFYSEPLIGFLLITLSFCVLMLADRKTYLYFALVGTLLAFVTLTRAVYMYLPFFIIIYCLWLFKQSPSMRRKAYIGTTLFLLCYFSVVGAWIGRNYYHFGRPYITERGGGVLNIRAEYNMMNASEYFASFLYWYPSSFTQKRLLPYFFGHSVTARLNRGNENGFYQIGRSGRTRLNIKYQNAPLADKILIQDAIDRIKSHPIKHILVSIPMAFRGTCVQAIYPFMFLIFLTLFFLGLKNANIKLVGVFLPSIYSYVFYSLFSHNIPRYNIPIIPIVWIGVVLFCYFYLWPSAVSMLSGSQERAYKRHLFG